MAMSPKTPREVERLEHGRMPSAGAEAPMLEELNNVGRFWGGL